MGKTEKFSDQLRRAVKRSEETRYAISQQTGIAQSILSRFVNQDSGLSIESIDKLCEFLGLRLVTDSNAVEQKKGR
jgi:DNA-binding phage protein